MIAAIVVPAGARSIAMMRAWLCVEWRQTYDSLSKVAFAITGTRWNGPRFFGLARRNGTSTRNNNKKSVCPTDQGPAA